MCLFTEDEERFFPMSHGTQPHKGAEISRCRHLGNISFHKIPISELVLQLQLHETLLVTCKISAQNEDLSQPQSKYHDGYLHVGACSLFQKRVYPLYDRSKLQEELLITQMIPHILNQVRLKIWRKVPARTAGLLYSA